MRKHIQLCFMWGFFLLLSSCQSSSFLSELKSSLNKGQSYYQSVGTDVSSQDVYASEQAEKVPFDSLVESSAESDTSLLPIQKKSRQALISLVDGVPLHPTMKLIPDQSFLFSNHVFKTGYLVFTTPLHIFEVTHFFKRHMPEYDWALMTQVEHSRSVLSYQNTKQVLVMLIYSEVTAFSKGETKIVLTMGPRTDVSLQSLMEIESRKEEVI